VSAVHVSNKGFCTFYWRRFSAASQYVLSIDGHTSCRCRAVRLWFLSCPPFPPWYLASPAGRDPRWEWGAPTEVGLLFMQL